MQQLILITLTFLTACSPLRALAPHSSLSSPNFADAFTQRQSEQQKFIEEVATMFPQDLLEQTFALQLWNELDGNVERYVDALLQPTTNYPMRQLLLRPDISLTLLGLRPAAFGIFYNDLDLYNLTNQQLQMTFQRINPNITIEQTDLELSIHHKGWIQKLLESDCNLYQVDQKTRAKNPDNVSVIQTANADEDQPHHGGYLYGIDRNNIISYREHVAKKVSLKSMPKVLILNPLQNIWTRDREDLMPHSDIVWRDYGHDYSTHRRVIFFNNGFSKIMDTLQKRELPAKVLVDFQEFERIILTYESLDRLLIDESYQSLYLLTSHYLSSDYAIRCPSPNNISIIDSNNIERAQIIFNNIQSSRTLSPQFMYEFNNFLNPLLKFSQNALALAVADQLHDRLESLLQRPLHLDNQQMLYMLNQKYNPNQINLFFNSLHNLVDHPELAKEGLLTTLYKALRYLDLSVQITNAPSSFPSSIEAILRELEIPQAHLTESANKRRASDHTVDSAA